MGHVCTSVRYSAQSLHPVLYITPYLPKNNSVLLMSPILEQIIPISTAVPSRLHGIREKKTDKPGGWEGMGVLRIRAGHYVGR